MFPINFEVETKRQSLIHPFAYIFNEIVCRSRHYTSKNNGSFFLISPMYSICKIQKTKHTWHSLHDKMLTNLCIRAITFFLSVCLAKVNKHNYNNQHSFFFQTFKWNWNDKITTCKWKQTNIYYTISFIWKGSADSSYTTQIPIRIHSILLLYILFSSLDSANYLIHYNFFFRFCMWTEIKRAARK